MKTSDSSPDSRPNLRHGGVLAGLLIAGLVVVSLALVFAWYVARSVRVERTHHGSGDTVSIDTPAGQLNVRTHDHLDPASIGVPIYPGASRSGKHSGGAVVEWTPNDGKEVKGLSVAGADFLTSDSPEKVFEYYQDKLPHWIVVRERNGTTRMEYSQGGYKRIVAIKHKATAPTSELPQSASLRQTESVPNFGHSDLGARDAGLLYMRCEVGGRRALLPPVRPSNFSN